MSSYETDPRFTIITLANGRSLVKWTDDLAPGSPDSSSSIATVTIGQVIITSSFDFTYPKSILRNLASRKLPLGEIGTPESDFYVRKLIPLTSDDIQALRQSFYSHPPRKEGYLFAYTSPSPRYPGDDNSLLAIFNYLVNGESTRYLIAGGAVIDYLLQQVPTNYDIYFTTTVDIVECYHHLTTIIRDYTTEVFPRLLLIRGTLGGVPLVVHLHLELYPSLGAVPTFYDIAAGRGCYYDNTIYVTRECLQCLTNREMYLDPTMVSGHYAYRLATYGIVRGIPLALPRKYYPLDPLIIASDLPPVITGNLANNLGYIMWYHEYHSRHPTTPLRDRPYPPPLDIRPLDYLTYLSLPSRYQELRIRLGHRYGYPQYADSTTDPQGMDMRGLVATNIMDYSVYLKGYALVQ